MKLNIVMFFNTTISAFTNPNFTDLEPEVAAKGLERALIANFTSDPKIIKSYENLEMFYVGTFDDETGIITQEKNPVKIFSPREIILALRAKALEEAQKAEEKKQVETAEEVAN